jgi:hypothetical protein
MRRHFRLCCGRALLTGMLIAGVSTSVAIETSGQATSEGEQKLLDDFTANAKSYVDKEHALPADKLKPTSDVTKLEQERRTLRQAVKESRSDAKQGDFFTAETAGVFRKLLAKALEGPAGGKIKTSLDHAEPGVPMKFVVNAEFPNQSGQPIQSMPPTLLQTMPTLPKGMEYCIAGKTLALRDASANMVIDFLPNALP